MSDTEETYAGDGLYLSFDGFMIKLRTRQPHGDQIVYLEPETYLELRRFARKCWPYLKPEEPPGR